MSRDHQKPIILLAFANEQADRSKYLRELSRESRQLQQVLEKAQDSGLCELVVRGNATLDWILKTFHRYRDRVAIFHYGGHANSYELLLESDSKQGQPAHASGFAEFLGVQNGLKLVFLNGCSTQRQADQLLDSGIPAVIATSSAIGDAVATDFAIWFYKALASGASLEAAYKEAAAASKAERGDDPRRSLYWASDDDRHDSFPWDLYPRELSASIARWNLPSAAAEPLVGLPALPADLDPPMEPFVHLRPFQREDAPIFFGRGYEIRELYNRINDDSSAPIVLFYGPTGVGKSSILAAGLLPRLEASHDVRLCRRRQDGLTASLLDALGATPDVVAIRISWCTQEEQIGKPVLVVIDQAEEAYTRQAVDAADAEVNGFLGLLTELFSRRAERPKGKLILSFREEWLARFEQRLDDAGLYYESQPLERLKPQGIVRAIEKPAEISRYRLHVADDLPQIIADDLREDRESPLAPTLEVLLTRMWEEAKTRSSKQKRRERRFDTDLYQSLKNQGYLLKDFLEQQLEDLRDQLPDSVDSGLALDILRFHTTELGTAAQRTAAEVADLYQHQRETALKVIKRCIELRLLVDINNLQSEAPNSRLTHDALAPLIRRRFDESDLPGQRALRILKNRAVDWREGKQGAVLDDADLRAVEQGQAGMRDCDPDELRLIKASRDRWAKERARRRSTELAAAANDALAIDKPQRALLLATEAVLESERQGLRVSRAEQVLRDAQSQVSGCGLGGHEVIVMAIAVSPDGRWLATASGDATARLWELASPDPARASIVLRGHDSHVTSVAFSRDGRWLATGSWDGTVRLWDLASPEPAEGPTVLHGHEKKIQCLALSPDGQWLATASGDVTAQLWNLAAPDRDRAPIALRGHDGGITSLAFDPNGRWLATGSDDKTARLWDLASPEPTDNLIALRAHEEAISSVAFDPEGRWLATSSWDDTVRLWELEISNPGVNPIVLRGHESPVTSAVFSPDGQWLATGSFDTTVRLWDLEKHNPAENPIVLRGHERVIESVAFSPDSRWLATGGSDRAARLWDLTSPYMERDSIVMCGHEAEVTSIAFTPDSRWFATGSNDATARLWDLTSPEPNRDPSVLRSYEELRSCVAFDPQSRWLATCKWDRAVQLRNLISHDAAQDRTLLSGHENDIECVAFSPDGRWLATGGADATARLWDLTSHNSAEPSIVLSGHDSDISIVAFSPDGRWLATVGFWNSTARLWDLAAPDPRDNPVVLSVHESDVSNVAFNADGRWLAAVSWVGTVGLWDLSSSEPADNPTVLGGDECGCVAFSPDGRWLATGGADATARLWDLTSHNPAEPSIVLSGHEDTIGCVAFSPDGRWLATSSSDKTARLWELTSRKPADNPIVLRGHEDAIESMAFSPDGRWLVSGSDNARLWNLTSPDPARDPIVLRDHDTLIECVACSPDGRWLATGSWEGIVMLWNLSMTQLLASARRALGRNATIVEWERYFPGEPYRCTFPDLPPGRGVQKQQEAEAA